MSVDLLVNEVDFSSFLLSSLFASQRQAGVDRTRALRALRAENGDLNAAMLRATAEEVGK